MREVIVSEGKFEYVDYGFSGIIIYAGHVNSCVLAIAFFKNESTVLAYHWVGFNMKPDGTGLHQNLDEKMIHVEF